jgi:3-methyladenine DNA glycosylase AlkD
MTVTEVMDYLESKGSEQTRKIYKNHGAPDNFFGVKVADLKPIEKKEKHNHTLALELFATGNSDAQYLAGLIADPKQFSKSDFEKWAKAAQWYMISEYAVAWNLAESPLCIEICSDWITSSDEKLQECAWAAMASYLLIAPDETVDKPLHESLINLVESSIHSAPNRVRYCMNGYIIALGGAVSELTERCKKAGDTIGKVEVLMGATACKVPEIRSYIEKMEEKNRIGKKKKTAKC